MIGDKIKELRLEIGYSITKLANLADVSKSYLSQIERGLQKNPSLEFLRKIATTLDTNIEYLLRGDKLGDLTVSNLDDEWMILIQKAIASGIEIEDFKKYINYLKFQSLLKEEKGDS